MNDNNYLFSLTDFLSANPEKQLGSIDYLHAVFKLAPLPTDLIFCFTKLFIPEFKLIDGFVFLEEFFDYNTYNSYLLEGKSKSEVQLWLNLIEVTGIFEALDFEDATQLASLITQMWNWKLDNNTTKGLGRARVIYDEEEGEVFITID
jgi:hypothetical protein